MHVENICSPVKRAYMTALASNRAALAPVGLTPARFELLYALGRGALHQRELARALGVAAPTVSRMLKALEALGLVARTRPATDSRKRLVELTHEGLRRMGHGYERMTGVTAR